MTGIRRKRRPVRAGVRGRRYGVSKGKGYQNILKTKRSFYNVDYPGTWDIFYDSTANSWRNDKRASVFHLNDVVNYTEFTNLFDAYKITGVKLQFVPVFNSGDPNMANKGAIPTLTYVRDYDDATTPNNESTLLEYGAHHRIYLDRMRSIFIRNPKIQMAGRDGSTGNFTGVVESKKSVWLDCSTPTVNHYGIKWVLPTDSMSTDIRIRVYATYYLQFKRTI